MRKVEDSIIRYPEYADVVDYAAVLENLILHRGRFEALYGRNTAIRLT